MFRADTLIISGMPFHHAHKVVGKIVGYSLASGLSIGKMGMGYKKLAEFSELYNADVEQLFNWGTAINGRCIAGETARASVEEQIRVAAKTLI